MMTMMDGASLSIPVPNIISSSPGGGRFDFDDGGVYCGGWQDGKAHGHGVCTGPKNVGEYSGSWNFGFEMSGVYKWKNGAVYEGRWQNGKRHGVGVEYNGKWIYKGEWSQGFKGRYGVKASSNSAVKYEGTWANGLQDGYGSETYSDGGYYQGQMCRGLRHGYGVRKSAPYGDSQLNNPAKGAQQHQQYQLGISGSMMIHSNSLQSQSSVDMVSDDDSPKLDDGFKPNIDRTLASKNGFVLVAKPLDVSLPKQYPNNNSSNLLGDTSYNIHSSSSISNQFNKSSASNRRSSLSNRLVSAAAAAARIPGNQSGATNHPSGSTSSAGLFTRGLRKLRKQKSTSDLAETHSHLMNSSSANRSASSASPNKQQEHSLTDQLLAQVPFTLSPEELDINDPTTVETYTGEWKQDKRNGHGVCERSDGLKYEGQWHNDMKCGYGVTTFKDGSKEEGKYKNNILIVDSKVKRFLHFGSNTMRQRIDDAIKMAHQAQTMALKKAEIADTRAATARDKADQATTAALEADRDSQIAFSVARQYSDSSQQQQQQQLGMMMGSVNSSFQPHLAMSMQDYPTMASMQQQQQQQQSPFASPPPPHNALQMRRSSQQHQQLHQFNRFNYETSQQQQQQMMQDQIDQQQQQQQMDAAQQQQQQMPGGKQFLGALEPFNGRRGSFRGGGLAGGGGGGNRSGPFGGGAASGGPHMQSSTMGGSNVGRQTSSSDPLNDLFDHYKAPGSDGMQQQQQQQHQYHPMQLRGGAAGARQRMLLSKQASLDIATTRGVSAGGQFYQRSGGPPTSGQRSLHRMSSMDHAEENSQQQQQRQSFLQQAGLANETTEAQRPPNLMEQQLRHLVTSGEEIQQQQQPDANKTRDGGSAGTDSAADRLLTATTISGQTPSGGSSNYILPQTNSANSQNSPSMVAPSTGAAAPSTSSFYGTNQASPSPDLQSGQATRQYYPQHQQHYTAGSSYGRAAGQFVPQPASSYDYYRAQAGGGRQRDVHSLADDQLYMAGSRRMQAGVATEFGGDRSDFSQYDFVISSAPRMTRRVMRRTASLSRNTPIRSISELSTAKQSVQQLTNRHHTTNIGSMANLRQRSVSPAPDHNHHHHHQQQHPSGVSAITITEPPASGANHLGGGGDFMASSSSPMSHLTLESSLSAASSGGQSAATTAAHLRKPSLQVRYDPNDLGGLMTREEVAALSHAQREQKRAEAELAESRAKRPLLHLYLTIKEFLIQRKLLLSVLMINICLFEMFANLIV